MSSSAEACGWLSCCFFSSYVGAWHKAVWSLLFPLPIFFVTINSKGRVWCEKRRLSTCLRAAHIDEPQVLASYPVLSDGDFCL